MEGDSSHFRLASLDPLKKIDRLFACNVGEHVDLPQLVVIGDQIRHGNGGAHGSHPHEEPTFGDANRCAAEG